MCSELCSLIDSHCCSFSAVSCSFLLPPAGGLLQCEVCGAPFETRRGLSSHARSHLRQLGIGVSESSGAPIDLLYQLIKERDGGSYSDLPHSSSTKKQPHGSPSSRKDVGAKLAAKAAAGERKPSPLSALAAPSTAKALASSSRSPSPAHRGNSRSASPLLRKAPISSLLPVSSPLRSLDPKTGGGKTASPSSAPAASAKPFWAPQETDAPLNLSKGQGSLPWVRKIRLRLLSSFTHFVCCSW